MMRALLFILALCGLSAPVGAHEIRPAALDVQETEPGVFSVVWRQPVRGGKRLKIDPVFPPHCIAGPKRPELGAGVLIQRWTLECDLRQGVIAIAGLERTLTDALLRLRRLDGEETTVVLRPDAASFALNAPRGPGVGAYLWIGVEHILYGPDHVLFVVGLTLVAAGGGLIWAITAFTVAHSLTLALSALRGLSLPGAPVEMAIALSVALLGYEALLRQRGRATLTIRAPWLAAFFFGLVHGLGFAGALAEIGLPVEAEALALLLFNVGVELGQLVLVALLLVLLAALSRLAAEARPLAETALAYSVGVAGFFWVFERVSATFL